MNLSLRFIGLICFALLLAACGNSAANQSAQTVAPANGTVSAGASVQSQTIDGLTISLEAPSEPKLLDAANFVITLTDSAGKPVEGADVYLDLLMTTMPMGTNKPVASPEGPGKYRAQGVFDMTGEWDITVHVTVAGKEHAAKFTSTVAEKK